MQFALLIYATEEARTEIGPEPEAAHDDWVDFFNATRGAGVYLAAEGLGGVGQASTVRRHRGTGEVFVTDGPFAETKEHLLGFFLLEVPDRAAALDWAARMPVLRRGSVEVRPLLPVTPATQRAGRSGLREIDGSQ